MMGFWTLPLAITGISQATRPLDRGRSRRTQSYRCRCGARWAASVTPPYDALFPASDEAQFITGEICASTAVWG